MLPVIVATLVTLLLLHDLPILVIVFTVLLPIDVATSHLVVVNDVVSVASIDRSPAPTELP